MRSHPFGFALHPQRASQPFMAASPTGRRGSKVELTPWQESFADERDRLTLFNQVSVDGSWCSPPGWCVRAVLGLKRVAVVDVDLPYSGLNELLRDSGSMATPYLIDHMNLREYRGSRDICQLLEHDFPQADCPVFPDEIEQDLRVFCGEFEETLLHPGLAAFAAQHFSSGVITGEDVPVFSSAVKRATKRTVAENEAMHGELLRTFRGSLRRRNEVLERREWLLGPFSYADVLLLSCVKSLATVAHGVDGVLGPDEGHAESLRSLHAWYRRAHAKCNLADPR